MTTFQHAIIITKSIHPLFLFVLPGLCTISTEKVLVAKKELNRAQKQIKSENPQFHLMVAVIIAATLNRIIYHLCNKPCETLYLKSCMHEDSTKDV